MTELYYVNLFMATLGNNTIIMPPECAFFSFFFMHGGSDNNKYCVMVSVDARSVLMLHVAAEQTKILKNKNDKKQGRRAKDEQII